MATMPFPHLDPRLAGALADKGYEEPTSVQAAVLESGCEGRDLLVSAQTGSGKTVAYGLALAPTLLNETGLPPAGAPLALIIAPTRELAQQVERELTWLYAKLDARIVVCVGGMDPRKEQRALERGAHIVVATPGRLRDHLERGNLDASALLAVVLDEADEMLDLGFREDLEFILDAAPAERRTLLFSATLAREIVALARTYQRDAVRIDTVQNVAHGDIEYRAMLISPNETEHAVVNVLRFFDARAAIVFCHTREAVRHLHSNLLERGFGAVALSGELSQNERNQALQALRDGRARVLVATDVAARGLDLPDLGLVIHAEVPSSREPLLHRSGRTGRAGKKGVSVLLVPYTRRRRAETVLRSAGVDVTWSGPPGADEIRRQDTERLLTDPVLTEENSEEDLVLARALLKDRDPELIAAALARLYRARLPSPEELFDGSAYLKEPREPYVRDKAPREAGRANADGPKEWSRDKREAREGGSDNVWFRLNIGREKNADPKWLIPLICRRGHVTKPEIGAIRIFGRETKFEIIPAAAERFAAAVQNAHDDGVKIEPAGAPEPKPFSRPRKDFGPREDRGPPRDAPRDAPNDAPERKPWSPPEGRAPQSQKPFSRPRKDFGPREGGPREDRGPPRGAPNDAPERKPWSPVDGAEASVRPDRPRPEGGKPPFAQKPFDKKPFGKAPFKKKQGGKPFKGKPNG
jgi:ATP-dependent RNA helicase DeaD